MGTLSTWDHYRQCGHARILRMWYFGRYKLGECFHYKCKITFRIALLFWTNIKYSQHVSMWLSVGIWWTSLTVGHLVYLRPWPAAVIKTNVILWYAQPWRICPLQIHDNFLESLGYSKQIWYLLIRFKRSFLSQFDKYLLLPMYA